MKWRVECRVATTYPPIGVTGHCYVAIFYVTTRYQGKYGEAERTTETRRIYSGARLVIRITWKLQTPYIKNCWPLFPLEKTLDPLFLRGEKSLCPVNFSSRKSPCPVILFIEKSLRPVNCGREKSVRPPRSIPGGRSSKFCPVPKCSNIAEQWIYLF